MPPPAVSIILPTHNRARFLPQAMASIQGQKFRNWELLIVDDGSTDDSPKVIDELTSGMEQTVRCIRQENQGAYGARNTGLDIARGKYIAFYDSDDLWLSHHLADCVAALNLNPDVDWVYGACRMVDDATGRVIANNTFYVNGTPRPFLQLRTRQVGQLHIIDDPRLTCYAILNGLYSGLQNSVFRRQVFAAQRFEADSRNEAEDQLFVLRCLLNGYKVAYSDSVNVVYRLHAGNSSAAGTTDEFKNSRVLQLLAEGYERLMNEFPWKARERVALRQRLKQEYFWKLGYATYWQAGRRLEAIQAFRRGLWYWPLDWRCWKTYVAALLRSS